MGAKNGIAAGLVAVLMLVCGAAGVRAQPAAGPENRDGVAVIIGNKTYKNQQVPAVEYAHRDAEAMKRFVIDVLGYREGNIIDLRDATQAEMISAFGTAQSFEGKAYQFVRPKRSDLFVYYSGHGVPGLKSQQAYLLPSDADPGTAELNGYPIEQLKLNLAKIDARSVTLILDACFSGFSPKGKLVDNASPVFVKVDLHGAESMTLLTASSGDQVASWDPQAQHGLFTEHLLRAFYGEGPAAQALKDGRLTLGALKAYLDDEMTYAARRNFNRKQDATVFGRMDDVLVAWPGGKPAARPKLDGSGGQAATASAPAGAAAAALARVGEVPPNLIQYALAALDHYDGAIDGGLGPGTRRAIEVFQRGLGAPATGTLSPEQTVALIEAGAKQGQAETQNTLAMMLASGIGLPKDERAAVDWFGRAAKQGNAYAAFNLAIMYRDGRGVAASREEARKLLRQARDAGHPQAAQALKAIGG